MKKQLLSLGSLIFTAFTIHAQVVVDTVSVGAGYANQKWYSLQNDEQGTTQSKDNWDLAFEINGYTATILANTQKADFAIYKAPYTVAQYTSIDSAGVHTWPILHNSDTTWTVGAFNSTANPMNPSDLGWGLYNATTHIITGDSCYIIKLSATSYKKIKLINLNGGVYSFEYANIDGTNSQAHTITKSNYTGKNFAYFNLSTNTALDREPASNSWDLTFVKYISFPSGTPYGVTGVLSNKGVQVAQADNVPTPSTYNSFSSHVFQTAINTIGYDWKEINLTTFAWDIKADTVFFVDDKSGNIWKLRFTKFGGSSTGNFIFSKEKISAVGIADINGTVTSKMSLHPNPSNGDHTTLLFTNEKNNSTVNVAIVDMNGKVVSEEQIEMGAGLNKHIINTTALSGGVYMIQINSGSYITTQKLIKQ